MFQPTVSLWWWLGKEKNDMQLEKMSILQAMIDRTACDIFITKINQHSCKITDLVQNKVITIYKVNTPKIKTARKVMLRTEKQLLSLLCTRKPGWWSQKWRANSPVIFLVWSTLAVRCDEMKTPTLAIVLHVWDRGSGCGDATCAPDKSRGLVHKTLGLHTLSHSKKWCAVEDTRTTFLTITFMMGYPLFCNNYYAVFWGK